MSAWMCSDKHIVFLVETVANQCDCFDRMLNAGGLSRRDLAQVMIDENVASLDYRYPDGEAGDAHELSDAGYDAVAACVKADSRFSSPKWEEWNKSARSYDYQSCEHPGWKDSVAYHWLAVMKALVLDEITPLDSVDMCFWSP